MADFNGDGIPDLVTANDIGGPYSVSILAGNGDGSFQSARDFGTAGARGLAVADLNGDGRADVAMAGGGWGYSTATVLLGNGDGTLQPPIQYGNGPGGHVAVADFNGDGWSDLAVSCYNNDVSVLLNAADWAATSPGSFAVSGFPSSTTAGAAGSFTVTAKNADGAADAGYTGTVHFTSSDPQAVLPADYTFTAADKGVHTFSATLKTAGTQSITATDITTASLVGMDAGITVNAAAASQFIISGPSSVKVGVPFSLTVTVEDAYGNVVTGYIGTIHFTSSDNKATLPANYTFTAADKGVHTFTGLILRKKGSQKITITDALDSSLTGSVIENVL